MKQRAKRWGNASAWRKIKRWKHGKSFDLHNKTRWALCGQRKIGRTQQDLQLLVIDEMSMLSAYYLGMIHEQMRRALHADHQEFGGIPVLLVGEPVQGLALYQAALSHTGIEKQARLGKSPIALQGARLFAKFMRLELTQQLRAIDSLQQKRINSLLQPDAEIGPELLRDLGKA